MQAETKNRGLSQGQVGVIVLVGALAFLLAVRLPFIGEHESFVADIGSYLITKNWILGQDPVGFPDLHFRPPLIGFLQLPFTLVLGDLLAHKVLAIGSSLLPAIPMYVLLRRHASTALAVAGAIAIVCVPIWGDQTAGGYLTVLNAAVIIWAVDTLWRIQHEGQHPFSLFWPALIGVGMNQTTGTWLGVILGVTVGAILVEVIWFRIRTASLPTEVRTALVRGMKALGTAALGALVWSWFYLVNLPAQDEAYYAGMTWFGFVPNAATIIQGMGIIAAAAVVPFRQARLFLAPALALVLASHYVSAQVGLANFFGRAEKLLPIFTVIAVVLLLHTLAQQMDASRFARLKERISWLATALCTAGLITLAVSWLDAFDAKASGVPVVDQENRAVMDWMRANLPYDARVMAHPAGLSWYVGGYAQRDFESAWSGLPGEWSRPTYEAFACTMGFVTDCNPLELRSEHDVGWVLIDHGSPEGLWLSDKESAPAAYWPVLPSNAPVDTAAEFSWDSWEQPSALREVYRVGDTALYEVRLPVSPVTEELNGVPVEMQWHDGELYVGYLDGRIATVDGELYADISEHVRTEDGFAQGMQGFLFAPNDTLYASYNVEGGETVARVEGGQVDELYTVQAPEFPQAEQRWFHNGGSLAWAQGDLYVTFGEFHTAPHDPEMAPQDWNNAVGGVVRLDPATGAGEVIAKGLRNPWKMAATEDGHLLIADVGEGTWEEINFLPHGTDGWNYGWPLMEGPDTYVTAREKIHDPEVPDVPDRVPEDHTRALYDYIHDDGSECGIIGGPVIGERYYFTDLCDGLIREMDLDADKPEPRVLGKAAEGIQAFAEDGNDLYYAAQGGVFRVELSALEGN